MQRNSPFSRIVYLNNILSFLDLTDRTEQIDAAAASPTATATSLIGIRHFMSLRRLNTATAEAIDVYCFSNWQHALRHIVEVVNWNPSSDTAWVSGGSQSDLHDAPYQMYPLFRLLRSATRPRQFDDSAAARSSKLLFLRRLLVDGAGSDPELLSDLSECASSNYFSFLLFLPFIVTKEELAKSKEDTPTFPFCTESLLELLRIFATFCKLDKMNANRQRSILVQVCRCGHHRMLPLVKYLVSADGGGCDVFGGEGGRSDPLVRLRDWAVTRPLAVACAAVRPECDQDALGDDDGASIVADFESDEDLAVVRFLFEEEERQRAAAGTESESEEQHQQQPVSSGAASAVQPSAPVGVAHFYAPSLLGQLLWPSKEPSSNSKEHTHSRLKVAQFLMVRSAAFRQHAEQDLSCGGNLVHVIRSGNKALLKRLLNLGIFQLNQQYTIGSLPRTYHNNGVIPDVLLSSVVKMMGSTDSRSLDDVLAMLLKHRDSESGNLAVDVNATDGHFWTPLLVAIGRGVKFGAPWYRKQQPDLINFLLDHGARCTFPADKTPLLTPFIRLDMLDDSAPGNVLLFAADRGWGQDNNSPALMERLEKHVKVEMQEYRATQRR